MGLISHNNHINVKFSTTASFGKFFCLFVETSFFNMERVLIGLVMLFCWVGIVRSLTLTIPPNSKHEGLLNDPTAEDFANWNQEMTALKEQMLRLEQQMTEMYRSFATLDLVAKNPSMMVDLNNLVKSTDEVGRPESVEKVRQRRNADPVSTTDTPITNQPNSGAQGDGMRRYESGPYSWPVLSGQCFLCPAGVPGPRGPPGPQGVAGRDGRDGRDASMQIQEPAAVQQAPASNPAPQTPPSNVSSVSGAVYIRWGKSTCPSSSTLVYTGNAAGAHYTHTGSGANYLCMPMTPIYANYTSTLDTYRGLVYSSEFETSASTHASPVYTSLHDHTPACAVCRAPPNRVTKLMIPGRNDCPSSAWRLEYKGYLMSGYAGHTRTEFICMDENAEAVSGTFGNENGALFYMVEARCLTGGGLPCGPYVDGRELTCAVCTI